MSELERDIDMIKLLAIDLDGTFLTDTKEVLAENVEAVHRVAQQGVKVVICTGRTLPGVRRFIEAIGLEQDDDYIILQNGAATHRLPDYSLVATTYQPAASREALMDFFFDTRSADIQIVAFDRDHLFLIEDEIPSESVIKDAQTLQTAITPISRADFLQLDNILKMMVLGPKEVLDEWANGISDTLREQFSVVRSQPVIIEFLSPNTNKATALKQLSQSLGIDVTDVMAIGDEQNDIEMLKWAHHSVAMGNASDEIKALTRYTTSTNNEAGVAAIINRLIG
ncbi:Cof-type HAD-IIB family hydrolase [Tuanshanicoccus lijuaniae]|uniref:Cof-type HAD-IIB family hydrolase n=1 Tax=Aerococcaceae bacterium zg-1292 TaxID=2774330 RepID=UPI001BD82777|nr:HAD family phosphatase [Aerococcaceae bacterium zg-A91]MBS4458823.1 HAD family phosphatase [Aerococcaceae bacterium zg-BR33]